MRFRIVRFMGCSEMIGGDKGIGFGTRRIPAIVSCRARRTGANDTLLPFGSIQCCRSRKEIFVSIENPFMPTRLLDQSRCAHSAQNLLNVVS